MDYVLGMYFKSEAEANEWLDFEASDEECEQAFYAENDRYEEWWRWRQDWLIAYA